jgi:hypothetical protein
MVAHQRCDGLLEIRWLIRDVMAHQRCYGSSKMWWLIRDVVAHQRCGGSSEMWWLIRDVVAHQRCGGSSEMWWLIRVAELLLDTRCRPGSGIYLTAPDPYKASQTFYNDIKINHVKFFLRVDWSLNITIIGHID